MEQKLTEPQMRFLRECASKVAYPVFPGPTTRVARGLRLAGLITIQSDYASLTDKGREVLESK